MSKRIEYKGYRIESLAKGGYEALLNGKVVFDDTSFELLRVRIDRIVREAEAKEGGK